MLSVRGSDLKKRIDTIVRAEVGYMLTARRKLRPATAASLAVGLLVTTRILSAAQPAPQAPDPNVPLYFEVASVKPNKSGDQGGQLRRLPGGRVNAVNMPLRMLITFAYQVTPLTLVGGPKWIEDDRFDIIAKLDGDPPPVPPGSGPDHMMLAMRTLLADRFRLKVHRETREQDVYALVMARAAGGPGPALKRSTQDCSPETVRAMLGRGGPPAPGPGSPLVMCGARMMPGRMLLGGMPISMLVNTLGAMVGRVVVDRSGLTGNWDFDLTYAPEAGRGLPAPGVDPPAPDPNAPSIFTALREQLGLRLEAAKAPVEVLVIDSVQQPVPD